MNRVWQFIKTAWRFSAKVFIFGLACSCFIGVCGLCYWYYQNRAVPVRTWKPEEEKDYGVRFLVKTEWLDGRAKYELKVVPFDKTAFLPLGKWNAWETDQRKIFFTVDLLDAGNFTIDNCSTGHLLGNGEDASYSGTPGKFTSIQFEGSLAQCTRHDYLSAESARVSWSLPTPSEDLSAAPASVPAANPPTPFTFDRKKSHIRHLRATMATDIDTQEYGSLVCGHVEQGETVILLQDDSTFVKVKTSSGQVGWAGSSAFEVVD